MRSVASTFDAHLARTPARKSVRAFPYNAPSKSSNRPQIWRHLSEGCRSLPRRDLKDEPADVCRLRAPVNMPFVSVIAVGTVRLDARQARGRPAQFGPPDDRNPTTRRCFPSSIRRRRAPVKTSFEWPGAVLSYSSRCQCNHHC